MRNAILPYLLVLLLAAAPLSAAETRVALTIGNSAYVHTPALPNPRRDAQSMAAALQGLGFKVIAGYDLDYNATKDLLRRFGTEAAAADVALFYYAGHAVQVDGQNYLLPVDTRLREEGDLKYESYPLDWAMQELGRARKLRLAILDACRDNPLAQTMARSMGARSAWDRIQDSKDPAVFRAFLARFPDDPVLAARARERVAVVEANRTPPPELLPHLAAQPPQPAPGGEAAPITRPAPPTAEDAALTRAAEIPTRFVQLALQDLGHYRGPIDGGRGAGTQRAVRAWQSGRALKQTGRLDHRQTVDLLVQAAEAGRPQSQNILGMMRASGIGLPQDADAARRWFEQSAAQGNAYAAFNLGVLYRDGLGVSASTAKARDYFEQARRGGHAEAKKALANLR